ncbi:hypothetical protein Angca_002737, partial [Angiostrongylus cantonensis]
FFYSTLLLELLTTTTSSELFRFFQEEDCSQLEAGPLFEVAEKICEFCHEISSHEKPNMRSECR